MQFEALSNKGESVFNAIWGNNGLRQSLFPQTLGLSSNEVINLKPIVKTLFAKKIADINDTFYNFINVK